MAFVDYGQWLADVDKALKARGSGYNSARLDRGAMWAAFQSGESPVLFAGRSAQFLLSPDQLAAQAKQDVYVTDTGMGACPQCGSRNLTSRELRDSNPGGCLFLAILGVCCFPLALIGVPFAAHSKIVGYSRICKACGNAWKVG